MSHLSSIFFSIKYTHVKVKYDKMHWCIDIIEACMIGLANGCMNYTLNRLFTSLLIHYIDDTLDTDIRVI